MAGQCRSAKRRVLVGPANLGLRGAGFVPS